MGMWNFVRDAGERIVANAKAAARFGPASSEGDAQPPKQTGASRTQQPDRTPDAGEAIANYIRAQNLEVSDLKVRFDAATSTVHVSGIARDQATREKVILCCGNIEGVEKVEENLDVREPAREADYHTVVRGDTLSAIAKKFYGDPTKYQAIFEANKPMLKHPDKIYPGQALRIPPLN